MNDLIEFSMKYQEKHNRAPNRSCYTQIKALLLARNHTSRSATGLPNFAVREGPL